MQEYVKRPIRVATAPAARRFYLNTLFFFTTSIVLLCIAAAAYPIIYYAYVPKKVVSLPVHLQYK
jgi:seipin